MIGVAIVGCGRWGPNHIRSFACLPGCELVAAVDIDPQRLRYVREIFPRLRCDQDYKSVLNDPKVNAIVICTPTSTHYALTREALEAGKHVLCEKPLCASSVEAHDLEDMARARELVLMVGHVFLFNAGIVKVKEVIEKGELGQLYYLSAVRTNLGPIRADVNAAFDLAAHDIAIFNWLLNDEPELVSAAGGSFLQQGIEDVVFISLKYPGNVLANIHASWLNPKKTRQITVAGSRKMITWDDLELNTPVAIYDRGADTRIESGDYGEFLRIAMWDGDVRLPKVSQEEPLKVQDRYFVDALRKGGDASRSGAKSGVDVVCVLEAISQSLNGGGTPIRMKPRFR